MINKLHLKNFQIHEDTTLEFDKGINVIIGETDEGKSSIVRALELVFSNRPSGDEFIRNGKKKCTVTVTSGTNSVQRVRGTKENKYVINDKNFDTPRTGVPEQVKEVLNFTSTNIQFQDDAPFLLSLNSSEVARKLNEATGLDLIDLSRQYVDRIIKEQNTQEKAHNKRIAQKRTELLKFRSLDEIVSLHQTYEEQQDLIVSVDEKKKRIQFILTSLEKMKENLAIEKDINEVHKLVNNIEEAQEQAEELEEASEKLDHLYSVIQNSEGLINSISKKHKHAQELVSEFEKRNEQMLQKEKEIKDMEKISLQLAETEDIIEKTKKAYEEAQKHFNNFKKTFDVCPILDKPCKLLTGRK